ncbi:MAG: dipeptidase [Corynebacteriales bacterium]|nr:dipeptidase [Mycobacteriales bacterium]
MEQQNDEVNAYIAENHARWMEGLREWLRIPSISADSAYQSDVRASAAWFADACSTLGFPTVEILETPGHPAVFAHWPSEDPNAITVLLYGHHDVQPVVPEGLWTHPPFEPTIVGDVLHGRGAIDDKGQIAFHLLGLAAHLHAEQRQSPAVNLKFLIEGEEEMGSTHLRQLLEEHQEMLSCDVIVVSDTTMFAADTPSVCLSMRGMVAAQVSAFGPKEDLHSGVFGGAVPNPIHGLSRFIDSLHDENGRVAIPGFYDDVVELSDAQRAKTAKLPFKEAEWLRDTAQVGATFGEEGYSTVERIGLRPTAECNGIWGGYTGEGDKTIIPSEAHAKLSFRLVADMSPVKVKELIAAYVKDYVYSGIRFEVSFTSGAFRPCMTPGDHPANRALVQAMESAFGQEILFTYEGGAGPQADLVDVLDAPVIFLGVGLPDDRFHAPNERARVPLLLKGAQATAYLWRGLAENADEIRRAS